MDPRRLICLLSTSLILPGGCNLTQPTPHTPKWLFDSYKCYNLPANVGRPLPYNEWCQRAIREDQQAAGLLPPEYGAPILYGARACADRTYRDWKAAVDDLWTDKYEALLVKQAARAHQEEAARRQRLLDEHAACVCQQEATCQEALHAAQHLLHERATHEHQVEAARCQHLLDKETARRRRTTQARQTAAAGVIFLWLRRQLLITRLARKTLRRLQHEAALACLHHEQECCVLAAIAEAQQQQKSAAHMKALADEADKWRR